MSNKRLYFLLLALIGLLLAGLLGGVYGANSLLVTRAGSLTKLKARSQALVQEQKSLTKAKRDIARYADLEKIAKTVVPEDKSQAEAVREIVNIAATNGIALGSIAFPTSTLGASAVPSSNTNTTTNTVAPVPTANSAKDKLSQLLAVKDIPGVYQLTITIIGSTGSPVNYAQMINFLNDLEHDRRTAQVSSIILQPDVKNHSRLTFTITLNEYIKP